MSDRYTPRRGLRRTEAAAYFGISASKFDDMVGNGHIPDGFMLGGCRIWDIHDLDAAFEELKSGAPTTGRRGKWSRAQEFDRL